MDDSLSGDFEWQPVDTVEEVFPVALVPEESRKAEPTADSMPLISVQPGPRAELRV